MLFQSLIFVSNSADTAVAKVSENFSLDVIAPHFITEVHIPTGKKSIGIQDVDHLKEWNSTRVEEPHIALIHSAHMLTDQAQNALLKLTEEPNENKILMYITHNPYALLETIRSRCIILYDRNFEDDIQQEANTILQSSFLEREKLLQELCTERSITEAQFILEKIIQLLVHQNVKPEQIEKLYTLSRSLQNQVQRKLIANTVNIILQEINSLN